MKYCVTIYRTDGEISRSAWMPVEPSLELLQQAVEGYIESVPEWAVDEHWLQFHGHQIAGTHVYCNEDGKYKELDPNPFTHMLPGYDCIVGNVVVVEKVNSVKTIRHHEKQNKKTYAGTVRR